MAHTCDNKKMAEARVSRVARACGGRMEEKREARAKGGKVKGGSTVNIVIGAPQGSPSMIPPDEPPMRSGPVVPPPPPMMGPPGAGPMPPMPRKRGGRIMSPADLTAGAGSGVGREQKTELQKNVKGK